MRFGSKPEKNQNSQLVDVTICELTHDGVYREGLQDSMVRKQYSNIYQGKCDLHTFVLSEKQRLLSSLNFICRGGGIGRHTALKMLRAFAHAGSSPVLGIKQVIQRLTLSKVTTVLYKELSLPFISAMKWQRRLQQPWISYILIEVQRLNTYIV